MVRVADRLADLTGLGEALVGAVLVGSATSLPDLITTVVPAVDGLPDLAVSNALGGVLAQTAFLAVADITYRRANLEHAAASLANLVQAIVLVTLLGGALALFTGPDLAIAGVHPGSLVLLGVYGYGLYLVSAIGQAPMWEAVQTDDTRSDIADEPQVLRAEVAPLLGRFAALAVVLAGAGFVLATGGERLVEEAGIGEAAVGVLVTGLSSSLAELVVAISAVRAGALTLAVGNVIGGNTFDTLLVVAADVAYRDGNIYAAVGDDVALLSAIAIIATAVLTLGLLRRERHGVGNIGVESVTVLVLYAAAIVLIT
jgi:cation:H+ antiporter